MIRLSCGCKINLGLKITALRDDGYHDLDTIFYPLRWPRDELLLEERAGSGISVSCVGSTAIAGENILAKIYRAFCEAAGIAPGLHVTLVKRIPSGAGLGGGSSDAACLLLWMQKKYGFSCGRSELDKIALQAGSDVPFFLYNSPMRLRGRGAALSSVDARVEGMCIVLVWPGIHIDTSWAFAAWDREAAAGQSIREDQGTNILTNIRHMDKNFCPCAGGPGNECAGLDLQNDFELPVFRLYPALAALKTNMLELGACASALSGSGSAIYGMFPDRHSAALAAAQLRLRYRNVYMCPLGTDSIS